MLDKAQITKKAQDYVAKGQIDKAIAEWQKLLAQRKDSSIYNAIGDLYLRKKEKEKAIEAFKEAAKLFREDGFYMKAIGIYKKILNINSSDVSSLIALGELNAEKGLAGNAVENFLAALEITKKEGAIERELDIYKKMLKLSPSDLSLKLKIAELSINRGVIEDAVKEYLDIASTYLDKKEYNRAREFYLKVLGIAPQNIPALLGLSRIAELHNNAKQAFEYLKKAISLKHHDSDILLSYSRLAIEIGDLATAKEALLTLIETDRSESTREKIKELEKSLGEEIIPVEEKTIEEAKPLLEETISQTISHETLDDSLDEAEFYIQEGLKEEAMKIYERLLHVFPDNEEIMKKIEALKHPEKKPEVEKPAKEAKEKPKHRKAKVSYI